VLAWAYELRPEADAPEAPADDEIQPVARARRGDSIVVLPFDNMSPDAADAYLADGLTEEITADLAGIRALRVISRTSAFQYRGTRKSVRTIGDELAVRYVLEGSVRRAGDDLRVTCQLIDATDDAHLWAMKHDGTMKEVFAVQERVARAVADSLAIRLGSREQQAIAARPIADPRAYELYLRARQEINRGYMPEALDHAVAFLEEAQAITGENAALLGLLAHAHYQYWNYGLRLEEDDLRLAREYAERAAVLDPSSPHVHLIQGHLEITGGSAVRGLGHFDEALSIDPDYGDAVAWRAGTAAFLGLREEAEQMLVRLAVIDPLNPFNWNLPFCLDLYSSRPADALAAVRLERARRPDDPWVEAGYALALAHTGEVAAAAAVIRQVKGMGETVAGKLQLAWAAGMVGDRAGVIALIDADMERWARKDFQYSHMMAWALAGAGETERALDWLDNSVGRGNINYRFMANDVLFAPLHAAPRFHEIVDRARAGWDSYHATVRPT
jgi:TolB-like protein/Tfp pilus assembly protein PilF